MSSHFKSAVVLTALPVERNAVLALLSGVSQQEHSAGTIYDIGTFEIDGARIPVAVAQVGAGNDRAGVHAERAIWMFQPDLLMFVGIAGGIKGVKHGDVVVGSKVYGYESGKAADEFLTRPIAHWLSHRLEQRIGRMVGAEPWAHVQLGPIASGDVLLRSTDSALFKFLRDNYEDALAIEMEGRGVLTAAHENDTLPAVVIRGISDLIDDKSDENDREWQPRAAEAAAAFALALVSQLVTVRSPLAEGSPEGLAAITSGFSDAYYLNIPRLLSDPTALRALTGESLEVLRNIRGWEDADIETSLRLRGLCERAIEFWAAPALDLAEALTPESVGARATFDQGFRTKNWLRFDPGVGLTGDLDRDPHIYTTVAGRKIVMPIEPRWVTTSTGRAMFNQGNVELSGIATIRAVGEEHVLAAPLALAPPVTGRQLMAQIFGH